MIRNRNGYFMSQKFLSMSPGESDPENVGSGIGGGTGVPAGDQSTNPAGNDQNDDGAGSEGKGSDDAKSLAAQLEQLKADMAKQKAALDEATREAGKYRKELRPLQSGDPEAVPE